MFFRITGRAFIVVGVMLLLGTVHWSAATESNKEQLYVQLLVDGIVTDLNELPGGDRVPLRVRLYRVPKDSACVPGLDGLCIYDYYLAIGRPGEYPRRRVERIAELASLQRLEWREPGLDGLPVLRLETDARSAGPDPVILDLGIGIDRLSFSSPKPGS